MTEEEKLELATQMAEVFTKLALSEGWITEDKKVLGIEINSYFRLPNKLYGTIAIEIVDKEHKECK